MKNKSTTKKIKDRTQTKMESCRLVENSMQEEEKIAREIAHKFTYECKYAGEDNSFGRWHSNKCSKLYFEILKALKTYGQKREEDFKKSLHREFTLAYEQGVQAMREAAVKLIEQLPIDQKRCRELMSIEQAWEEGQMSCVEPIRMLSLEEEK